MPCFVPCRNWKRTQQMRHKVAGKLFGRTANQRKALLRGLVSAVIEHQRIETTVSKAKETRKLVERLVTIAKRGDLHAKRIALSKLPNRTLIVKLFDEIAPRFADRNGGYTRIIRTRRRVNDRAELAVLEFVDYEEAVMSKKTAKSAKADKADKKDKAESAKKAKAEAPEEASKEDPKEEKKATAKKKPVAKKKTAEKKTVAKKTVAKKKPATKKKADR